MTRSERVYRWLLRLYPRDFRDEYGEEMALLVRARHGESSWTLWLQIFSDLAFHVPREHWSTTKHDLRYAIRTLRRTPTFAVAVIATLAMGIGANSVIFGAVDAVLLRHAPVSAPDTLVDVYTTAGNTPHANSSYPDFFDLRDSRIFASLAAYTPVAMAIDVGGQTESVPAQLVSGDYFAMLGITMTVATSRRWAFRSSVDACSTPPTRLAPLA